MSDYTTALDTVASQDDWERMSKHAGISPSELKAKLIPALENEFGEGALNKTAAENEAPGVKLTGVARKATATRSPLKFRCSVSLAFAGN